MRGDKANDALRWMNSSSSGKGYFSNGNRGVNIFYCPNHINTVILSVNGMIWTHARPCQLNLITRYIVLNNVLYLKEFTCDQVENPHISATYTYARCLAFGHSLSLRTAYTKTLHTPYVYSFQLTIKHVKYVLF